MEFAKLTDECGNVLRKGMTAYLENPLTPEETIVFGDPPPPQPGGRTLRVTKIDHETRTVTFDAS